MGDSDEELSPEACRIFRSMLCVEAFKENADTAEQQQANDLEEARTYHMLREHGARRLKKRMLSADYAQFMLKVVKQRKYETMAQISSQQLNKMKRVLKDIPRVKDYIATLQRAYEEDREPEHDSVAYMVVKAGEPTAPATTTSSAPAKTYVQPQPIHGGTMEWTFEDGEQPPLTGGNKKFPTGTLKGKTWMNVTM